MDCIICDSVFAFVNSYESIFLWADSIAKFDFLDFNSGKCTICSNQITKFNCLTQIIEIKKIDLCGKVEYMNCKSAVLLL